jgi:hypothetical protein
MAEDFLTATRTAAALATSPVVAERWSEESACAGMTVGGLACHLADQSANALRFLQTPPDGEEPIPLLEHYARAAWVRDGPDGPANVGIREGADARAADGPAALAAQVESTLAELPAALRAPRTPDTVHVTWQGWTLTTRDFLVTRLMETVVHSDDLAVSVHVDPPTFPDGAVDAVLDLLTRLAVRRHGVTALVRALSRQERAPGSVAAF